jgi:hypothetical protein
MLNYFRIVTSIILLSFAVLAIRKFQHQAQVQLSLHREHLYEYLSFIRNQPPVVARVNQHWGDVATFF